MPHSTERVQATRARWQGPRALTGPESGGRASHRLCRANYVPKRLSEFSTLVKCIYNASNVLGTAQSWLMGCFARQIPDPEGKPCYCHEPRALRFRLSNAAWPIVSNSSPTGTTSPCRPALKTGRIVAGVTTDDHARMAARTPKVKLFLKLQEGSSTVQVGGVPGLPPNRSSIFRRKCRATITDTPCSAETIPGNYSTRDSW